MAKRSGLDACTPLQLDALKLLREKTHGGKSFVFLDEVHGQTLTALMKRAWITKRPFPELKGVFQYAITPLGLEACVVYEAPPARYRKAPSKGICPICGSRASGTRRGHTYCDECDREYYSKRKTKRAGLPWCSRQMLFVLRLLNIARERKNPFVELPGVHGKTINALFRHQWITKVIHSGSCPKYAITDEGVDAYNVYTQPKKSNRLDGICSRCGIREKGHFKSGRPRSYCMQCSREMARESKARSVQADA